MENAFHIGNTWLFQTWIPGKQGVVFFKFCNLELLNFPYDLCRISTRKCCPWTSKIAAPRFVMWMPMLLLMMVLWYRWWVSYQTTRNLCEDSCRLLSWLLRYVTGIICLLGSVLNINMFFYNSSVGYARERLDYPFCCLCGP